MCISGTEEWNYETAQRGEPQNRQCLQIKFPVQVGELKWSSHNKKSAIQNFTRLNDIYVTWKLSL